MEKRQEAEKIVKTHVIWSIGAGFVPIPFLDIAAVTLIQLDMLKQLCRLYEVDYYESKGKATLSTVTGSTFARIGASAIKSLPGLGTILGSVSMPILSGASTYAIAQAVMLHFESEGDLFDLDLDTFKQVYKDHLQKGKEYASKLNKERQTSKASSSNSVFKELEELLELKNKGAISEEEFEAQKQKLLERL